MTEPSRIFPTFRYHDTDAALRWLAEVPGFRLAVRFPEDGAPDHAELALGSAMIMIGRVRDDGFNRIVGSPGRAGAAVYVAVDDADATHARAVAAGSPILEGLTNRPYGSREFICADPGGYVWCFGTYWPRP